MRETTQQSPAAKIFFVRVTHTWNEQVLLIIHHSLVSCLANFSHIAGDQKCNPGCLKTRHEQQTAVVIRQAGGREVEICLGEEFRK